MKENPAAKEETIEPQPIIPLAAEPEVRINGDEITIPRDDRRYRIRGLAEESQPRSA